MTPSFINVQLFMWAKVYALFRGINEGTSIAEESIVINDHIIY